MYYQSYALKKLNFLSIIVFNCKWFLYLIISDLNNRKEHVYQIIPMLFLSSKKIYITIRCWDVSLQRLASSFVASICSPLVAGDSSFLALAPLDSNLCLTTKLAVPSFNFFMKFQASILDIRVQSVLFTDMISSPTFKVPFLSAAPP